MFELLLARRWRSAAALAGIGTLGFAMGAWQHHSAELYAQNQVVPAAATAPASDYSQRVVAYIHGNIPITREDLGEFLIARQGASRIDLLVNRRIIEHACKQANITVTPEEVEATINDDLKQLTMDRALFVKQVLRNYNKTLYEWKEDVIKPRLMLQKLVQTQVKVDDAEVRKAFDAMYGEKVNCRMIIWPQGEERVASQMYDKIRKSEAEFASAARAQAISQLAQSGGRIDPIGHGAADDSMIEKLAFGLKKDELSELFTIPGQGVAVLKCDGRIPADTTKVFEKEKESLHRIVFGKKVEKMVPVAMKKLQDEAKPLILMKYGTTDQEVQKAAEEEMNLMSQEQRTGKSGSTVPLPQHGDGKR
jgi:hypothetical protein